MKKLLCAVLSGIMAFSTFAVAVPITASAAESQESVSATYGDFEYTLEDDYTCTITKYNGSAANVTIPSTIYGYKVSALSDTAFLSNKNIRSVIIPNGVLRIGALCFDSCTNLQEITIPDSVMYIVRSGDARSGGFLQFCDSLKEITLGSGLENFFDTYDLNGSHSFECIDISKNNKYYCSIDGVAFSKDKKKLLKYPPAKKDEIYTIPDSVSKLSMPMGFTLNENLKAVIIPKSVKEISLYTFGTSLNSIYGYKGTVAETYAKENGFKFIEISEPTSVSLNKTSLTLDVGKSYTLTKTVSPSNAVTSYTWSSSNTSVATVDGNGKVTAKASGTATITVKTSNGKTATCKVTVNLPAPQITGLANTTGGIKISWNKVDGAYGYRLYYKPASGGWKRFKDTTATSFTDSGVVPNKTETYTIRCIDKNGNTISGFNSTGWSKKYTPAAPTVSKLDITTGGIKLSWNKIAGVYGYRLYYKPVSGGWKRFKDTTATSFTDSGVVPNKTETYTIRCIDKNGNTISSFNSNGWSKKYTPVAPTISKLENTSGGIKISWNKIAGVYGYRLYYKTSSGGWKRFKDTTATSFTDSGVSPNRTETYTIRCIDKNGNTVSGFYSMGWSKKYTPVAPTITRLSNTSKGVSVTWNKIAGVYGYRLYRKYDGGSWTKVKDTTSTSFTDSGAKKGKKVTYTVRCIDRKGKTVSGFNSKGWSITRK
jgi:fibronectin type 3 domain-containing protein